MNNNTEYNFKHRKLFAMLHATGTIQHRGAMISGITQGRTESVKDLTDAEMDELITALKKLPKLNLEALKTANIKNIVGLCYGIHNLAPHLSLIQNNKPNYDAINHHIEKKFHSKNLSDLRIEEQKEIIKYLKILKSTYGKSKN